MQGTMNFVKCNVELKTKEQIRNETTNEYYKVFGACKDTVNAHGGEAGHHKQMFEDRMAAMLADKGIMRADFNRDGYEKANKKRIDTLARDESQEEQLACLFLLMSDDGRFKLLKTVVEAKRMTTELITLGGKSNGNERQQQTQSDGEHGLAFIHANSEWQKNVQCHG